MVRYRALALIAVAGLALTSCGSPGTPTADRAPSLAPAAISNAPDVTPAAPDGQTAAATAQGAEDVEADARVDRATRSEATTIRTVVVLDPGHNGGNSRHPEVINKLVPAGGFKKPCNTTGTATNSGYSEHAYTWDVAKRTAKILRAKGIIVVFTRHSDHGVGPCVNKRAAIANKAKAALTVSIHADGASSKVRGYHVIEPALSPDKKNRKILTKSDHAARALLTAFGKATKEPRAKYPGAKVKAGLTRRNDLAGLNLARVPAIFIECGNMRNAKDAKRLKSAAWRQKAAQGIANGILAYVR